MEGPFKVGYSDNPQRRLSNIQTGQAVDVFLHYSEETESGIARVIEKLIHRNLAHKRVRGEWFSVTLSEAIDEVKFAFIRYEAEDHLAFRFKRGLL